MEAAPTAATSLLPPSYNATPAPRKLVNLQYSISAPSPSKLTRRKNYLRPKLLKTLTKHNPNHLLPEYPPSNAVIPFDSPDEQLPASLCEQIATDETEGSEYQELQISEISEPSGVVSGDFGGFSTRSVLQLGLFLVGAFVFKSVWAVWVGISGDNKAKSSVVLNESENSVGRNIGLKQGLFGNAGVSEMAAKIVEIQAMARDARARESLEKANGYYNEDAVKIGIENKVDRKLDELQKRWQNSRKESPVFPVNHPRDGVDGDSLLAKDANNPLMLRKKFNFISASPNMIDKPKGFQGSKDRNIARSGNTGSAIEDGPTRNGNVYNARTDLLDKEHQLDPPNGNSLGSDSLRSEGDGGRKSVKGKSKSVQTPRKKLRKGGVQTEPRKENGVAKAEAGIGATQETVLGSPSVKPVKSRKSSMSDARNSQSLTKEIQETTTASNGQVQNTLPRNGILNSRDGGSECIADKVEDKQSVDKAGLWWLSLPYVLAINMQRGHDGMMGLFSLKTIGHTEVKATVAFEDIRDATNFCHILHSFFEDLGDFSTEIVPLPVKELDKEVRSHSRNVIVVRKGQLKMYAGQPLADVEMALRSLV